MPESKLDFQIICPTRNPNNEFRKLAEKKMFERKQEKQKEKDQETQAIGTIKGKDFVIHISYSHIRLFTLLYIIGIISIFCQIC